MEKYFVDDENTFILIYVSQAMFDSLEEEFEDWDMVTDVILSVVNKVITRKYNGEDEIPEIIEEEIARAYAKIEIERNESNN